MKLVNSKNANLSSLTSVSLSIVHTDLGAVFHGYSSDITRTFLPNRTEIDECDEKMANMTLQDLWSTVYAAQTAAIAALTTNHTCADVDLAARGVIEDAGLGKYFTHRLGHGLGIEGHERPYLNKGNTHIKLRAGNVFTAEPGIPSSDKVDERYLHRARRGCTIGRRSAGH